MPLYEYRCTKCGHRFERIQTYSAPDPKECPLCQGEVERLISAPVAHFKGSGFYSTDYGAKPASSAKPQEGGSGSDSSSTGSDKDGSSKGSDKTAAPKTESASTPAPASSSTKSE
jgi:putative FmdB family regulatory protein